MGEKSIIVAGFGGQGVLFLGRLIAYGGMIEGKNVTWFPSYGAEMRGGTANCTTVIADRMIGSPVVRNPDILIAMNDASLRRFLPRLKSGGLLIYNASLILEPELRPDVVSLAVPASELAASLSKQEAGASDSGVKAANMVMLGALLGASLLLKVESIMTALDQLTPEKRKKALGENRVAITKGIRHYEDTARDHSRRQARS